MDSREPRDKMSARMRGTTREVEAGARALRWSMTAAEWRLWQALRVRQLGGLKDREARQVPGEAPAPEQHIAPKMPPDPVEELPPDQKPEGDNVQWIPGYWHWDEDRTDFIWISGFWRVPPPGRVWVPGSWRESAAGWQWVSGFWQDTAPVQPGQPAVQPDIEYLPQPPMTLEL